MRGLLRYTRLEDGRWVIELIDRDQRVLDRSPAGTEEEAEQYERNYKRFHAWEKS